MEKLENEINELKKHIALLQKEMQLVQEANIQNRIQQEENEKLEKIRLHESTKYRFRYPCEEDDLYSIIIYTTYHNNDETTTIDDVYLFFYKEEYDKTLEFLENEVKIKNKDRHWSEPQTRIHTYVKLDN